GESRRNGSVVEADRPRPFHEAWSLGSIGSLLEAKSPAHKVCLARLRSDGLPRRLPGCLFTSCARTVNLGIMGAWASPESPWLVRPPKRMARRSGWVLGICLDEPGLEAAPVNGRAIQ